MVLPSTWSCFHPESLLNCSGHQHCVKSSPMSCKCDVLRTRGNFLPTQSWQAFSFSPSCGVRIFSNFTILVALQGSWLYDNLPSWLSLVFAFSPYDYSGLGPLGIGRHLRENTGFRSSITILILCFIVISGLQEIILLCHLSVSPTFLVVLHLEDKLSIPHC